MQMFEELLSYLDAQGVRFVVVGGLAVVIHGHARLTVDIDLVLDLDTDNVRRAIDALTARGLRCGKTTGSPGHRKTRGHRQETP